MDLQLYPPCHASNQVLVNQEFYGFATQFFSKRVRAGVSQPKFLDLQPSLWKLRSYEH